MLFFFKLEDAVFRKISVHGGDRGSGGRRKKGAGGKVSGWKVLNTYEGLGGLGGLV